MENTFKAKQESLHLKTSSFYFEVGILKLKQLYMYE